MVVKLAPWDAAHCNSLRPGRRCLVRTESSTAVRGIARAPLAARPWVAGGINAPDAPYRPRLSLAFKLHACRITPAGINCHESVQSGRQGGRACWH
jgi:hypothetical protein